MRPSRNQAEDQRVEPNDKKSVKWQQWARIMVQKYGKSDAWIAEYILPNMGK